MGLFRPYQRTEAAPAEPVASTVTDPAKPAKKTVPTPTRKEAEQARRERVHPTLTAKEARRKEQQLRAASRDEQFKAAEAQPGKALLRDFIDARRSLAAWSMPVLMVTLLVSLLITQISPILTAAVSYLTWIVLLAIVVDLFLMWRSFKKLHAERLPRESLKGLLAYAINRSINLRRLRMPAPRVNPGDKI